MDCFQFASPSSKYDKISTMTELRPLAAMNQIETARLAIPVRALQLGERIDLKGLEREDAFTLAAPQLPDPAQIQNVLPPR